MKRDIHKKFFFRHTPDKVWEYLTNAELLGQWLMKNDFKPEVGHHFQFIKPSNGEPIDCEVLDVVPMKRLAYSWKYGEVVDTIVIWELVPTREGTELLLDHTGFAIEADFLAHDAGWTKLISDVIETLNALA